MSATDGKEIELYRFNHKRANILLLIVQIIGFIIQILNVAS
jgi:preprotein translocase subunit Sss1